MTIKKVRIRVSLKNTKVKVGPSVWLSATNNLYYSAKEMIYSRISYLDFSCCIDN